MKLYYFHAPMNAGKSMALLAKAYNFEERGIPFLILKSRIDTRDGLDKIYSRALGSRDCVGLNPNDNAREVIKNEIIKQNKYFKWILVDESQFLTEKQVNELSDVVDYDGINVICYGLRTDFKTGLFEGSKRLFEIADTIEELKTTCNCGNKAIYNARIDKNGNVTLDGEQIEVGGNDKYLSMCRKCYKKLINLKN